MQQYTTGMSFPEPSLLLRPEEAARMLGISRSAVYGLTANGELVSVKINNSRRIPREALDAYVTKLRRIATQDRNEEHHQPIGSPSREQ